MSTARKFRSPPKQRVTQHSAAVAPTTRFDRWSSGVVLAVLLAVNHGLMMAVFPVLPNNDSVSYVEFGHVSTAKRPIDHYAPPDRIPSVAEIPEVEAWREYSYPSYGYPWLFLDLPEDWKSNLLWVTQRTKPPLATDRLVPVNREWDNAFPMGASLYVDLLMLIVPASERALAIALMNHAFVVAVSFLLWCIGSELGWVSTGWLAGLAYGLVLTPGARAQEVMTEPLFIVLDTLALYLIVRGCKRNSSMSLAAGGAALAIAFAVRAVALLQPLIVGVALIFMTKSWREWITRSATCGVPFAVLCVLVFVHNWVFYGRFNYSTAFGRHLFNRVVLVDGGLDPKDESTRLILDLAKRPRSGGNEVHPYQIRAINISKNASCWTFYWMLRWQGMNVEQADGCMKHAALAAIRADPVGYLKRSVTNIYTVGRGGTLSPFIVRVSDPQAYERFLTRWFMPQFSMSPYNWVAAQWRVFKEEIPLYGPPQILSASQRQWLIQWWDSLPRILGAGFYLAILGATVAVWHIRREWWAMVAGWYLALLVVPTFLQAPNSRYAEPAAPVGLLLIGYAVTRTYAFLATKVRVGLQVR